MDPVPSPTEPESDLPASAGNGEEAAEITGDARPSAERPALWEWLTLSAVVSLCVGYWVFHYHKFVLPPPDSFSFVNTAREIWSSGLPSGFKRMPLFPLLMGFVAKFIPAREPELEAALVLNLLFSAGSLVLLFLLARKIVGWAAILPVAIVSVTMATHSMAVMPLVEPCMGFTTLLALWLFQMKSRWQYLAAGLAALTRYEAAALIGGFFVLNWIYEKKLWKHLLLAALASSGFLTWMLLSVLRYRGAGGNPYVDEMQAQGWITCPEFAWRVIEVSFEKHGAWALGLLTIPGLIASWKKCRRESAAVLIFGVLYVVAHILYGHNRGRYVYPIRWILPLYLALSLFAGVDFARERLAEHWKPIMGWALAIATCVASFLVCRFFRGQLSGVKGTAHASIYIALPILVIGVAVVHGALAIRRPVWGWLAVGAFATCATFMAGSQGLSRHARLSWKHYYKHYGSHLAGEWLRENLKPDEKALIANADLTAQCAGIEGSRAVAFSKLEARAIEELRPELNTRKIRYVIYQRYKLPDRGSSKYAKLVDRYRPQILDRFEKGEPVPGFEHVTTLEIPKKAKRKNVQIYRVLPPKANPDPDETPKEPSQ